MEDFDFRKIRDPGLLDRLPAIGKPAGILLQHGIYEGDAVREWIHELLVRQRAETFGKLRLRAAERLEYEPSADTPPLVVFATDITRGRLVQFSDDYPQYGRDPDRQLVADAVRASLSIPLFFEPVKLDGCLLVDGGVLSNYAIDAFDIDDPAKARWPTFGMTLLSEKSTPVLGRDLARSIMPGLRFVPRRLTGFLEDLIGAAIVGQDFHALSCAGVAQRTVQIDANAVGIVDFDISSRQKLALIQSGREAAEKFLRKWDGDDGRAGSPRFPLPRKRSRRMVTA